MEAMMGIEGKFWLLEDDEDLSFEKGRFYELRDGVVLDGRTGEGLGTYTLSEAGADLIFNETHGDRRILQFRMVHRVQPMWGGRFQKVDEPFDPDADSYQVHFTSEKWEAYHASHPAADAETEADWEAQDAWQEQADPLHLTFGHVYRDHPEIAEIGMKLDRECEIRLRREKLAVVS